MRYSPGESSPWYTSQVVLIRTLIGAEQEVELDMAGAFGYAAATQQTDAGRLGVCIIVADNRAQEGQFGAEGQLDTEGQLVAKGQSRMK